MTNNNSVWPPSDMDGAIEGLAMLAKIGSKYPISSIGAYVDSNPLLASYYSKK